jgi:hypothetical protein
VSMLASIARAVVTEQGEPRHLRGGSYHCSSGKGSRSGDIEQDNGM